MMIKLARLLIIYLTFIPSLHASDKDLSVVGFGLYTEALGRLSITTVDMLKDDLKINYIPTDHVFCPDFISPNVLNIMVDHDKSYAPISLIYQLSEEILQDCNSEIKILYTMFDASAIAPNSGDNCKCDILVLPDQALVDIYRKGGYQIPIFVLPCPISLDEFLSCPLKQRELGQPFVFGSSGAFVPRKNHIAVLEAFFQEFGNNPMVKLKLHGRWGSEDQALRARVEQLGMTNVEIINKTITQQAYIDFMSSLDCYVFLSKGEGYSITPREALACGIPCILTNNTAHTTLCDSGFVKSVPSEIAEPCSYCSECGNFYGCTIFDARKAMHDVYHNYKKHLKIAENARKWVCKYDHSNLKQYYLSLVKPKKVILGNENKIGIDYLMTDSPELFNKYKDLGFDVE